MNRPASAGTVFSTGVRPHQSVSHCRLWTCQQFVVAADDARRFSFLDQLPLMNQQQPTAKTEHSAHVVRHHKNGLARISKLSNAIKTLFSKSAVSDAQYFVDDQNVRINLGCNRESQTHIH